MPNQPMPLENLFDPNFYRTNNPDLVGFSNQQALQHWRDYGIAEGRTFSPLVDLNLYRSSNGDLSGLNNRQLLEHLANYGLNEGRVFSAFVNLNFYRSSNGDLSGLNNRQLLEHLANYGLNEGRVFSPFIDLNFYRNNNLDLPSFNNRQLLNHLFTFGLNQGRAFSQFVDLNYYRAIYSDLSQLTNRQLFDHLGRFGVNEARVFSPFIDLNYYRASNGDLVNLNNRQLWEHFILYGLGEGRSFSPNPFNSNSGYGLVNAAAAVATAIGESAFAEVPNAGGTNWGLDAIKAPEVWNRGYTGQGIVVAVIDTGVNYTHGDLDNNIWINPREIPGNNRDDDGNGFVDDFRGWDFTSNDNDPMDTDGHGTHVSGIIAAENNDFGTTGVAFNAKIMPVRVLGEFGGSESDVADGIRYAVNNGADVINLSLGGDFTSPQEAEAIRYAVEKDVVLVMAAGNEYSTEPAYPARYSTHFGLAVGAVNRNNQMPAFSNTAGTTISDYVVAPGNNIYSTFTGNSYEFATGTSMASPYVAGVAALILSANPNLSPVLVERILTTTANGTINSTEQMPTFQSFSTNVDRVTGNIIDGFGNNLTWEDTDAIAANVDPVPVVDFTTGNPRYAIANFNQSINLPFDAGMGYISRDLGNDYTGYLIPETLGHILNSNSPFCTTK